MISSQQNIMNLIFTNSAILSGDYLLPYDFKTKIYYGREHPNVQFIEDYFSFIKFINESIIDDSDEVKLGFLGKISLKENNLYSLFKNFDNYNLVMSNKALRHIYEKHYLGSDSKINLEILLNVPRAFSINDNVYYDKTKNRIHFTTRFKRDVYKIIFNIDDEIKSVSLCTIYKIPTYTKSRYNGNNLAFYKKKVC